MSLNWNFQRGEGSNQTNPLWEEYGYLLGQHNIGYFITASMFLHVSEHERILHVEGTNDFLVAMLLRINQYMSPSKNARFL